MKNLISLVLLFALVLSVGCATDNQTPEDNAARMGRIVETLAFTGATLTLEKKPESRPAFAEASVQLLNLASSDEFDLLDLREAIEGLPFDEIDSTEAKLVAGNLQIILDEFGTGSVALTNLVYLKPIAGGVGRGIKRALE